MAAFQIEYPTLGEHHSSALVFTAPRGDKVALFLAQIPGSPQTLMNHIEAALNVAFQEHDSLTGLDEGKLEIYMTFRLMPEVSKPGADIFQKHRKKITRVLFPDGMKRRAKGITLSKEWSFQNPKWGKADEEVTSIFDREAWKLGYVPQAYSPKTGWAVPGDVD